EMDVAFEEDPPADGVGEQIEDDGGEHPCGKNVRRGRTGDLDGGVPRRRAAGAARAQRPPSLIVTTRRPSTSCRVSTWPLGQRTSMRSARPLAPRPKWARRSSCE